MKKELVILLGAICLVVVLSLSTVLIGCDDDEETMEYKIGITKIVTHAALDENEQGFIDRMAELGFVEGENVEYLRESAEGDITLANTIAQMFVDEEVDLIHSIATPTSLAALNAAEGTGIPVIFGSVTDPTNPESQLVDSWEQPGGDVTGVSDWLDVPIEIEMALSIMPDIEKMGVVYNAGEPNSVSQVDQLKAAASDLGLSEVVEATADSSAAVITAAQSLVGRVDAVWVGTDNTVVSGFEALVGVCEDNDIPLFASDTASVDRGAIAAKGLNYYDVGVFSADIAARVLNGENAGDIPVRTFTEEDLIFAVNPAAAERMGITIPQDVLDIAEDIVDETADETPDESANETAEE